MSDAVDVMTRVRQALGRPQGWKGAPPAPPTIEEPVARLVHSELGLPELFAKRATELKMRVEMTSVYDIEEQLIAFLRKNNCRRVAVAQGKLLDGLNILQMLRDARLDAHSWNDLTLDQLYDGFDCGITDVNYAVAECGTLVIKPHAGHGRGISLVPMYHVAILEPKNFLPDLIDLMEKLAADPEKHNVILISGPSKTADIEMNTVTGVHGPNVVQAFILR